MRAAWAQVTAPSQGGEVNLVLVTATTMELKFGTTGTGQGRVVSIAAIPEGAPVPLAPADNIFYAANSAYGRGAAIGKGYVVYNGAGHTATVTGLQPNMYYYVTNAEYNTDGAKVAYNNQSGSMATSTRATPAAFNPAPVPLPVELTSFTGTVDARGLATLRWATATELNSAFFAVERSPDGVAFAEVGRVLAAGNSVRPLAYQWPDPQPLAALTYYRLRQTDRTGVVRYSTVLSLLPPRAAQHLDVYPNPGTSQHMQLLLQGFASETLTLHLADALGRLVATHTLTPGTDQYCAALPLPTGLAAGTYFLTLAGSSGPIQKRITVFE